MSTQREIIDLQMKIVNMSSSPMAAVTTLCQMYIASLASFWVSCKTKPVPLGEFLSTAGTALTNDLKEAIELLENESDLH